MSEVQGWRRNSVPARIKSSECTSGFFRRLFFNEIHNCNASLVFKNYYFSYLGFFTFKSTAHIGPFRRKEVKVDLQKVVSGRGRV